MILKSLGKIRKAIKCYKKALKIKPEDPDIYNNIGVLFFNEGSNEEALEYFNRALEIEPENKEALENKEKILTLQKKE